MTQSLLVLVAVSALVGCGGAQATPAASSAAATAEPASGAEDSSGGAASEAPAPEAADPDAAHEFKLSESDSAARARGVSASKIKPTRTQAAIKFFVVDKDSGPTPGVVISLTAPDGTSYYTEETDGEGYAEVLVPVGQKYDLVYLSLGRRDIAASVPVSDQPNQNVKLTLRYKRYIPPPTPQAPPGAPPRFVLGGVEFDTGKAKIRSESFPRLDSVVEYMAHKKSARIEIAGHTDNVGNPKTNKALSLKRAQACRDYLVSRGIEGDRIVAVGHGDEQPLGSNDTEQGRQRNRRIEASEL